VTCPVQHVVRPDHRAAVAERLVGQRFDMILAWPNALALLANHMLEQGLEMRYRPRLISCVAETMLPAVRRRLGEVFGCPVVNWYDMTEMAGSLTECEHGRLHLDFEVCCVEAEPVAGSDGRLVRVIFTGWTDPAMPFIRYAVGDVARVTPPQAGPCPCGRQSLTFEAIDGRTDDYVRTPDGRMVVGLNVHLPSAAEVQVYQPTLGRIEVRVAPGPRYDPGEEAEMLRRLRGLVGAGMDVRIQRMDAIPRSPTGKFRAVLSEVRGQSPAECELADAVRR
jgi:phenylacetate-CoA ligase